MRTSSKEQPFSTLTHPNHSSTSTILYLKHCQVVHLFFTPSQIYFIWHTTSWRMLIESPTPTATLRSKTQFYINDNMMTKWTLARLLLLVDECIYYPIDKISNYKENRNLSSIYNSLLF